MWSTNRSMDRCNTLSTITRCTTRITLSPQQFYCEIFVVHCSGARFLFHCSFVFLPYRRKTKRYVFFPFLLYRRSPLWVLHTEHIEFLTHNYRANDRAYAIDCLLRKYKKHADNQLYVDRHSDRRMQQTFVFCLLAIKMMELKKRTTNNRKWHLH